MKTCKHESCTNKHDSHGYCGNHARQYRKYGHPLTKEEVSAARAEVARGNTWNKGTKWTQAMKQAQSKRLKGRWLNTGVTHFKKGMAPANKGKKMSQETKDKMSKSRTIYTDCEKLRNKQLRGKSRSLRNYVFARDNETCQVCFSPSNYLHMDHIKSWSEYPELRFEPDNCRTLCMACHYYVTYKKKLPKGIFWGNRSIA